METEAVPVEMTEGRDGSADGGVKKNYPEFC